MERAAACLPAGAEEALALGLVDYVASEGGAYARCVGPVQHYPANDLWSENCVSGPTDKAQPLTSPSVDGSLDGAPSARRLRALTLASEIARSAPLALRMAKAAVNAGLEVDLGTGLRMEEAYYGVSALRGVERVTNGVSAQILMRLAAAKV